MAWTNSDGLRLKFGTEEGTVGVGGEFRTNTSLREIEFDLDYSVFASATAGANIVMDNVAVPNGARIERVQVVTETAFDSSGDGFIFNMGLVDQDRSTELDFDGLIATCAQSRVDTAGEILEIIVGDSDAGALIGTTLTNTGLVVVDYDTAAPTVGRAVIRIFYYIP